MIAILTKSDKEETSNDIIDWLRYYNADYIRINGDTFFQQFDWSLSENHYLDSIFKNVNIFWFRRWLADYHIFEAIDNTQTRSIDLLKIYNHLSYERNSLNNIFWKYLKTKKSLSNPLIRPRKVDVLREANNVNLDIPETIITTNKEKLLSLFKNDNRVITKPISDSHSFIDNEYCYSFKTSEITEHVLETLPNQFPPTLFQQLIDKDYEIRVFYLNKMMWSMAIFSQLDTQTSIDFRIYNKAKPIRNIPYSLPQRIQDKLILLMQNLGCDTGSIDIIRGMDGKYYFLEVNFSGQFGMTSSPCNYYLESEVAKYLIKNDNDSN